MKKTMIRAMAACGLLMSTVPALASGLDDGAFHLDHASTHGLELARGADRIQIRFLAPNVLDVHGMPDGKQTPPGIVMNPHPVLTGNVTASLKQDAHDVTLSTAGMVVTWDKRKARLIVADAQGHELLHTDPTTLMAGRIVLNHDGSDPFYGIGGYDAFQPAPGGILRAGNQIAVAGQQGHPGAPFVWSTRGYGVLVDTVGAHFDLVGGSASIDQLNRKDVDYDIIVGPPPKIFDALSKLSGPSPMFPKWAMGFTNSQWGIDQKELLDIVDTYRAKHIPIDNFTIDFDWKAWGQDNYGEFRWNATKFPGGPDGKLKAELTAKGMHLTGIMKPRIHVDTVEGRYAQAHDFWFPDFPAEEDYFSHKPVRELDFDKPAVRAWFFNAALKHSFDTGIVGWWNDEADDTGSSTQFLNMERSLYDGQRAYSPLRVWSINRDFYLGAQRYAYGLWSGDINTGFASMAAQRQRMLSAIDTGEMKWGMDGGGFNGHPSDENYARWIEFGAFTPIFRVHGTHDEKRQPWRYGPIAEAAATKAIRLRYALLPYIYAYEHGLHVDGVGLVRPLTFAWPDDPKVRNDISAWMFGDSLLVSPVVKQGQTVKHIYLPAGRWTDWFTGKVYQGGQSIAYAVDATHWSDIPLFIRDGAIIPMQPVMDYVGEHPVTEVTVQVFPADRATRFDYYDDDGSTYAYEHGVYFSQELGTQRTGNEVTFTTKAPSGTYKPALKDYLVAIHGITARSVDSGQGGLHAYASADALKAATGEGWATGTDRYGPVTWVRLTSGQARSVTLHGATAH
ncbi:TIM-barrel domain-containing protein [Dyella sp. A6]|uniref:TIM-barrel domain-containing protein n=1 Tax=Dyella aluminiiresistens TaxID=3069105 RepID=UPI002E78E73E|nr:TIM-barrel domain-containing protein [Dyella sp. A6]